MEIPICVHHKILGVDDIRDSLCALSQTQPHGGFQWYICQVFTQYYSPCFRILFAMANMTLFRFYPGIILHECNTIFWIFHMSNIPAYLFFIVYTPCLIPFTNTLSITMTFL